AGEATEYVEVGEPVTLAVRVRARAHLEHLIFGYMIRDRLGQPMFGTNTHHTKQRLSAIDEGHEVEFQARFAATLGPGSYSISVALTDSQDHLGRNYQWKDLALIFTVVNGRHDYFIGSSWLPPQISIGPVLAVSEIAAPDLIQSNLAEHDLAASGQVGRGS
ncbi:MAG: Wzt carbohydrate-binding domain-containing protein, partial [Lysobacter sp.]